MFVFNDGLNRCVVVNCNCVVLCNIKFCVILLGFIIFVVLFKFICEIFVKLGWILVMVSCFGIFV